MGVLLSFWHRTRACCTVQDLFLAPIILPGSAQVGLSGLGNITGIRYTVYVITASKNYNLLDITAIKRLVHTENVKHNIGTKKQHRRAPTPRDNPLFPQSWAPFILVSDPDISDCPLPSSSSVHASCMSDIVFSIVLLLVLGLVIVVPRLVDRTCPRLGGNCVDVGAAGDTTGVRAEDGKGAPLVTKEPSPTLPGAMGFAAPSAAAADEAEIIALPASDSASRSSGGNRSFSISCLRLDSGDQTLCQKGARNCKALRILKTGNGFLDALSAQRKRAVR
jgi:hypothetical protein